uniref:FLZ-type domain-containing protein n=1 Tax=Hordeum vulgare subsp. vulgare TaxID=112509 RepID=A0A8I6WG20_HORVV
MRDCFLVSAAPIPCRLSLSDHIFGFVFRAPGPGGREGRMMLRRVVFDQAAAGDALDGAAGGRPRSPAFFAVPRLLVGLAATKRGTPDCDSTARASLLGSPRSPRSWDSQRVGLGGLVDSLAEPAADAKNRLLGFQMRPTKLQCLAKSYTSPPKDCGHAQPELGEAEATAGAGGMSVPCTRFYGDVKSGPEVIVSGGAQLHLVDRAKFPASGSLPVSIGGPRRYIGSVSAMEVEQSEDYTCIIAHGSNPKTTRIFGDCILEPCPVLMPDWESKEIDVDKEGAELYWLVADEESTPGSCSACNKDLDGNGSYVYRGENAFCGGNCRNQAVLNKDEDENNPAVSSPSSPSSTSQLDEDDIFT